MGTSEEPPGAEVTLEAWELESISEVTRAYRTTDPEELRAELAWRALELKRALPPRVRNWRAYLIKFLYNKATNWVRDRRMRERRLVSISGSLDVEPPARRPRQSNAELRLAFEALWNDVNPELRLFWQVLLEENGNQVATARRLRKHRNTIRSWIKTIRQTAEQHGF